VAVQFPADDPSGERVQHHRQIDELRFQPERHVDGYNLSIADECYVMSSPVEEPGQTVRILAEDTLRFASLAARVIEGLERHEEFLPSLQG
jgi:hypothetical protein